MTKQPNLQRIEVRSPPPIAFWQAIETGEFSSDLAVERHTLEPGEVLPTGTMMHAWLAHGDGVLVTPHDERSLAVGDLVTPGADASLRAGATQAVFWTAALPLPLPLDSTVTVFAVGTPTILAGDLYTVKRRAAETEGQLGIVHFAIPPGGGPIPHIHYGEDEIFIVLEGRLSLYADGVRTHAAAGDVVCLPRGIPHGFHNLTNQPAAMLCLLTPGGGEQFFLDAGRAPGPGETPKPDAAEITRILALAARYRLEMLPQIAEPYVP